MENGSIGQLGRTLTHLPRTPQIPKAGEYLTEDFQNIMPIPTSNKLLKNSLNTHRPRQIAF